MFLHTHRYGSTAWEPNTNAEAGAGGHTRERRRPEAHP